MTYSPRIEIIFPAFSGNIFILHRNDICGSSAMTPDDKKAKALDEIHLLTDSIFNPLFLSTAPKLS
jgi:hypothetical protein